MYVVFFGLFNLGINRTSRKMNSGTKSRIIVWALGYLRQRPRTVTIQERPRFTDGRLTTRLLRFHILDRFHLSHRMALPVVLLAPDSHPLMIHLAAR
jgi:hypothetical protein